VTEDHAKHEFSTLRVDPEFARRGGRSRRAEDNITEIWPIPKRQAAKLDHHVTHRKQTTSHFLIDNFERLQHEVVHPEPSRRVARLPKRFAAKAGPASSSDPLAFRISNRHIPELESLVSHRKQRIGPLSNRHNFAFCNFAFLLHSRTFATRLSSEAAGRIGRSLLSQTSHCARILRVRKCLEVRAGGQA
jgi:hypothetical protein